MRRLYFIILILLFTVMSLNPQLKETKQKHYEGRLQLGFGTTFSTNHILGVIESFQAMADERNGKGEYKYPGLTDEELEAYKKLPQDMKTAVSVYSVFAALEYAVQARILWNAFITHADLSFIPMESGFNGGRFDMLLNVNAGVRLPFFIMPYITGGVNFTFSFYPEKLSYMVE